MKKRILFILQMVVSYIFASTVAFADIAGPFEGPAGESSLWYAIGIAAVVLVSIGIVFFLRHSKHIKKDK